MRNNFLTLLFCVTLFGVNAQNPADLDVTFGDGGVVQTLVQGLSSVANDLVIQPDGKMVVAGEVRVGTQNQFCLVRYNTDGTVDTNFGQNGFVAGVYGLSTKFTGIAIQNNGQIVATGIMFDEGGEYKAVVARYTTGGVPDNTFGTNGFVKLANMDNAEKILIQNDGKFVLGGYINDKFGLSRVNADGSIDATFGENGYVQSDLLDEGGVIRNSYIIDLALQNDGKIVAVGFMSSTSYSDLAVARYNADGSLDNTFNGSGFVAVHYGHGADFGTTVKIQPDNKIVVGGHKEFEEVEGVPEYDIVVTRFNTNGTPDESFGNNGVTLIRAVSETNYMSDIALQNDGKIVFTGQVISQSQTKYDIVTGRLNSDGTLDPSFGNAGIKIYDIAEGSIEQIKALELNDNGNILLAGYLTQGEYTTRQIIVMRMHGVMQTLLPSVAVEFSNVAQTTYTASFTPNSVCQSYTFVAMSLADVAQFLPWFGGSMTAMIKQFGMTKAGPYVHNFTEMVPNTDYYVYTICKDANGVEAPYDSSHVRTLVAGGTGTAEATIEVSEITATTARVVVTPNSETALFHSGLITKAFFDEIGQDSSVSIFMNNNQPMYSVDDHVWPELQPNTEYKAIAICKNSNNEWGPAVIVDFTTIPLSINELPVDMITVSPNPSHGEFKIKGTEINGANIRVIDLYGRELYRTQMIDFETTIDLTSYSRGIYIVEFERNGAVTTTKLVKQ